MDADGETLESKLKALRDSYTAQLPGKLAEIERLREALRAGWDTERAALLHRLSHSLAGSGSTFGYPQLSQHARAAEQILKPCVQDDAAPDRAQCIELDALLTRMRAAVAEQQPSPAHISQHCKAPPSHPAAHRPLVYLLEDDRDLAAELDLQLTHFGYRVRLFHDSASLQAVAKQEPPAAFIADIMLPEGPNAGVNTLREMRNCCAADVPVIFMSSRDDFEARLAAVRAGGDAYFVKPLDMAPLVDRLDRLTRDAESEPYRILIVDDDVTLAAHYRVVLEEAGMQVQTVSRAGAVMKMLSEFHPELILMDIYMPECSGLELAKLIRQQESYVGIPIVFLSTENNLEKQLTALHLGGDEFITKPVESDYLAASVGIRAARARFLSAMMVRDSLTGLLNHSRIKEQLAVEVARARRSGTPLAFVMVDIDHFKDVNDRYGHMMGDQVIRTLARLFRQRLRKSDSVGRYGGEEFAAILPDCDLELARDIIEHIRALFSDIHFTHEGKTFSVTFSAGLATWPEHGDPGALNRAADEALYEAKRLGRDRVAVAAGAKPKSGRAG